MRSLIACKIGVKGDAMDVEVTRRICLARHLYGLAESSLKSSNDLFLFSAANLLQDSVEVFLLALCDFLRLSLDSRNTFDKDDLPYLGVAISGYH